MPGSASHKRLAKALPDEEAVQLWQYVEHRGACFISSLVTPGPGDHTVDVADLLQTEPTAKAMPKFEAPPATIGAILVPQ